MGGLAASIMLAGQGAMAATTAAAVPPPSAFRSQPGGAAAGSSAARAIRTIRLSGSPGIPAANPETGTVYVPIQCGAAHCQPGTPAHTVAVINAAKCNTRVHTDCRVAASIKVGNGPIAPVVDQRTDTIYVTNSNDNTVSVINGARCNGRNTRGCRHAVVATVKVGGFPIAAAFNPATRTVYVGNLTGSISLINGATCNARVTRGCHGLRRTISDQAGPAWIGVDIATDTVYVSNQGTSGSGGDTVSVINGKTCNAHTGTNCGIRATVKVGLDPFALAVDQATDTVYVANAAGALPGAVLDFGSVSVINGARCNAKITAGCGRRPATVPAGSGTGWVVVDDALHTVFAVNHQDDTLSAINTRTCNGKVTSGCSKRPPNEQAMPAQGPGFLQLPNSFALLGSTAYVMNTGGAKALSVVGISQCNAANTSGCRREAPAFGQHEFLLSEDASTGTIYAGNAGRPRIDVIRAATCRPGHPSGCAPVATIPMQGRQVNVGDIDHATHTLYASDPFGNKVAVINTAACNAGHTSGCSAVPTMITVGKNPGSPAFNPVTKTLYVPDGPQFNEVAVINAATCNATDKAGCGQTPAQVNVGKGTFTVAVSPATDTVYASAFGLNFDGRTIAVINGATCDGTNHSGCGHVAATIRANVPYGIAVDDHTHTMYVAINAGANSPGSIAVINSRTCNGTHTAGCRGPFPHLRTSATPTLTALDTRTGVLYVLDNTSAELSEVSTARCSAIRTGGCGAAPRVLPVSSAPEGVIIDQHSNIVYLTNAYQSGSITVLRGRR